MASLLGKVCKIALRDTLKKVAGVRAKEILQWSRVLRLMQQAQGLIPVTIQWSPKLPVVILDYRARGISPGNHRG